MIATDENYGGFIFFDITGKRLKDFTFPRDLFTSEKVDTSQYALDNDIALSTFLDGVVAISKEGQLDFVKNVPGTIVWQKNSVACWAPRSQFKGVDIQLFKNGLPLFRIGQVNNLPLWATFIPNNIPPDEDEHFNLTYAKTLYDNVFTTILQDAIRQMPSSSSIRIRNCTSESPLRYHIPGYEIEQFSESLKSVIHTARLNENFPAFLTFNFVSMAYGQDTPLTDTTMNYIEVS